MSVVAPPRAGTVRVMVLCLALGLSACAGTTQGGVAPAGLRDASAVQMRLADATLAAGAPATALRVLDERLQRDPHDVAALTRRGSALAALGRSADAAQSFASALKDQPNSLDALNGLAMARAAMGEAVEAEDAWRRALALRPDDIRVQTGLAISLDLQARHHDAQVLYRAALAASPDNAVARADLGLSLALSGHAAEGLPFLQEAALGGVGAGQPGNAMRARHNLAVGLVMAGDQAAAARVLSEDLSAPEVKAAIAGLVQFAAAQ